ncbi:MAG: Ig-like domain-containing protein [Bacteroidota bacterium]
MKKIIAIVAVLLCITQISFLHAEKSSRKDKHKSHNIFRQFLPQFPTPVIVYGPKEFEREHGSPKTMVDTFSLKGNSTAPYTIVVTSAFCDDKEITSATIKLNGVQIFGPSDFKKHKPLLIKKVTLAQFNTLSVKIAGKQETHLLITIVGKQSQQTDTTPPTLALSTPVDGMITKDSIITVSGTATDNSAVSVKINGIDAVVDAGGAFTEEIVIAEGLNTITVVATDASNNASSVVRTVRKDATAPQLTVNNPQSIVTNQQSTIISGMVFDETAVSLSVNGTAVTVSSDGSFTNTVALNEGKNTITVVATDAVGNSSSQTRIVLKDSQPPIANIISPGINFISNSTSIEVSGTISDSTAVSVTINGAVVTLSNGSFQTTLSGVEGNNTITIIATDEAGNSTTVTRAVIVDTASPIITISSPSINSITNQPQANVTGTVSDSSSVTLTVNGNPVSVNSGSFTTQILLTEGRNVFTFVATDAAGNSSTETRVIILDTTPPIVNISSPNNNTLTNETNIQFVGSVYDSTITTLTINGIPVSIDSSGIFTYIATLLDGTNTISIVAVDAVGNTTTVERIVNRDSNSPVITIYSPIDSLITNQTTMQITGLITDASSVTLTINGNVVALDSTGAFSFTVSLNEGGNSLTIVATDAAGNSTTVSRFVVRDSQPPMLSITSPIDSAVTNQSTVQITGVVFDSSSVAVSINGTYVTIEAGNSFLHSLNLTEGLNTIAIVAEDGAGNTTTVPRIVIRDSTPPALTIAAPNDSTITNQTTVLISGAVSDATSTVVVINGNVVALTNGAFSHTIALSEGSNIISVNVSDAAGNVVTETRTVILDTAAPALTVTLPVNNSLTNQTSVVVSGSVDDSSPVTLTVNGLPLSVNSNGSFSVVLSLVEGSNSISIVASDVVGNSVIEVRTVILDSTPPVVNVIEPADGITTNASSISVSGTVTDAQSFILTLNGSQISVVNGSFNSSFTLSEGNNVITIVATDTVGNFTSIVRTVTLNSSAVTIPPDPATVAPPIDQTVTTTVTSSTQFIYTGSNPIQTGVDTSMLDQVRIGVIRGKVLSNDAQPLSGVTISILDHPEFGQTVSRVDGMYDLVVNGGGKLVLSFQRTGYLPVQRQVDVPWQDYIFADSIIMIQIDNQVTQIDFSDTIEIARGSVVSDVDGNRQATLLFKQGTSAWMTLANGDSVPLTNLSVRATEYTVGENGPASMPAQLPPTSGYTYCVELSVDEAISASATDVRFSQPVSFYVDNFIGFPVGTTVPSGYYDRTKGEWVPSNNGIVTKIVGFDGTKALLDITGDDVADDELTLSALGISTAEQERLTSLYSIGQSLWRVEVDHFTPWDYNWPYVPPSDAVSSNTQLNNPKTDKDKTGCGSIIGFEHQTLGEVLPITGTPFSLYYASDRTEGYKQFIDIPVSGPSIPLSLKQIVVEVMIAGTRTVRKYQPAPNISWRFYWNQKDGYGRTIQGKHNAEIHIGYVYSAQYSTPYGFGRAFGATPPTAQQPLISASRDKLEITYWKVLNDELGTWIAPKADLGGWSLSDYHSYDVNSGTLFYGNTQKRSVLATGRIMQPFAGNGEYGALGDGGAALNAQVGSSFGMCAAPDGSVYYADADANVVRKIDPQGIITTVAGVNESAGFAAMLIGGGDGSGDGGLATQAFLSFPTDVALGPDGSLYIAEDGNSKIRRVRPDGMIETFAGIGGYGFSGDGGKAIDAELADTWSVAVGPDGSVYIGDAGNNRVRKVTPDGYISTVAGNGNWGLGADGILATESPFMYINALAVGSDGALYIVDQIQNRVRKVGTDGIISTVAGTGSIGYNSQEIIPPTRGDGGPAKLARLVHPTDIALASDGSIYISENYSHHIRMIDANGIITRYAGRYGAITGFNGGRYSGDGGPSNGAELSLPEAIALGKDGVVYIADNGNARIRRITNSLTKFTNSEFTVSSEDGTELYQFDANGRHLKTTHSLTGATLLEFSYNTSGSLAAIHDANNLTMIIERDGDGKPNAIVSPYGQRSILSVDSVGYLSSMLNPAGEGNSFGYSIDGLLYTMKDAKQSEKQYGYNINGRLISALDPIGGGRTLTRTELANGYEVVSTTAQGQKTKYRIETIPTSGIRSTMIDDAGLATVTSDYFDGTEATLHPNGTTISTLSKPDPRFGMQSPLTSVTVTTPGGLQSIVSHKRTVTELVGLTVMGIMDSVNANGKVSLTTYDGNQNLFTTISPQGRKTFTYIDSVGRTLKDSIQGMASVNYVYDTKGRIVSVTQGERTSTFTYDSRGRVSSATDPLLRTAGFVYDSVGRTLVQTLPDGNIIAYRYDVNGNLLDLTPPGKPEHTFDYTATNLTNRYAPPIAGFDTTITNYLYDLDKRITHTILPNGDSIVITYDSSGCGCGGSASRIRSIAYGRGLQTFGYNSLTGMLTNTITPEGDTLLYTYDGSLSKSVQWKGNVKGTVSVAYDNNFRVSSQSVNGVAVNFGYNNDGQITNIGGMSLTYDPQNGLPTGTSLGNITTSQSYNNKGELASYTAAYGVSTLFATSYSRDSLGRITALTETSLDTTKVFLYGYDTVGRLEKVWIDGFLISQYTYDANGNRVSRNSALQIDSGSYDAQDRMLSYGNAQYFYTANGELQTKVNGNDTARYTYDNFGNLTKVVLSNGDIIEYIIDGQNRRIGKKLNGSFVKRWIYSGQLSPVAEVDSAGNMVARFVGGIITKGGATYRLITDHLGSIRLVVNTSTGAIAQRLDYDEFGNIIQDTNPDFQPFAYAGGLYDTQTKLIRFGARDYDASVGRWTSKDPIKFRGSSGNLFAYVANDPINKIDKNGKVTTGAGALAGLVWGVLSTALSDALGANVGWQDYVANTVAGTIAGAVGASGGVLQTSATYSAVSIGLKKILCKENAEWSDLVDFAEQTVIGAATGKLAGKLVRRGPGKEPTGLVSSLTGTVGVNTLWKQGGVQSMVETMTEMFLEIIKGQ